MGKHSKLGNLTIEKTGLLSNSSTELIEFIIFNKIDIVSDFIAIVDSDEYASCRYPYVLSEARGLSDLLKYKYFNDSLVVDVYLESVIKEYRFNEERSPILMFGIQLPNREKKNIYHVINRLGFNDRERDVILDTNKDVDGMMVIDLLHDAHDRLANDDSDLAKVLKEKLLLILKYYLYKGKKRSEFNKAMEKTIEEFNDVLARKFALEGKTNRKNGGYGR